MTTIKDDLDLRLLDGPEPETRAALEMVAPRRPQRRGLTPTRIRLMVAGLVLLFATGYLVFSATGTSAVYYLTVTELRALGNSAATQPVRVGGVVVPGTIERDGATLKFVMVEADPEIPYAQVDPNAPKMHVTYKGVIPDIFQDEVHVVVEGKLTEQPGSGVAPAGLANLGAGVFEARTLLAKCPSRFESMPADAKPGPGHPGKQVSG